MKIVACLIVKDNSELSSLNKAIDSVQPFVDAVYVTANGEKTDKIQYHMEKRGVNYSYKKWNDNFADMRTFNFSQVKEDADFIFWMDADDILIGGEKLREVGAIAKANAQDVVFFTYWYGCEFSGEPSPETLKSVEMEQMRERLLKPGVTIWRKRLHETPVPVTGVKNNYTTYPYEPGKGQDIVVMHTAQVKDPEAIQAKMDRNKRILELELKDERLNNMVDPRTLLYLMKIYAEQDIPEQWGKVIEMGEDYLTKSGWNEERATALEQMGIVCGKKQEFKEATEVFHRAIAEWPYQPLIYIRLATAYFNLKEYAFAKYWAEIASNMNIDNKGSNLTNYKAMKLMFAELSLKLNYNYQRDTKKALESANLLYSEAPTPQNYDTIVMLESLDKLNEACGNVDKLARYLDEIGETERIAPLIKELPEAIIAQPFAHGLINKYSTPRTWEPNEICYFANFGKHFEEWSGKSLSKGIGGSETAVIKLAEEWTKLGYKVTVYGDPGQDKGIINGVTYLPYFHFNPRDNFNIFVQWRNGGLANKVKAKKFLVDLHDIWGGVDYKELLPHIDKFMVKSKYHRECAPEIPDEKFLIVGNGI